MNKKERVMATFAGLEPDRTPTGFWMHFPKEYYYGDAAVKKHLEYFEKTQTDICKVMTEYMYPCDHRIKAAADWQTVQSYNRDADFIRGQADIIKRIADIGVDGSLAATIHGVVASASHTLLGFANYDGIGRYAQLFHLRTNPGSRFLGLPPYCRYALRSGAGGGSCGRGGHLLCSTRWRGRRLY